MSRRTWRLVVAVVLLVVTALVAPRLAGDGDGGDGPSSASDPAGARASSTATPTPAPTGGPTTDPASGLPYVDPAELPAQAREVLAAIAEGGPFAYPGKDGSTFGNREGLLPDEPSGYYREYTVPTPGSPDRGARRIITGDDPAAVAYWTDDHYDSFSVVRGGVGVG